MDKYYTVLHIESKRTGHLLDDIQVNSAVTDNQRLEKKK